MLRAAGEGDGPIYIRAYRGAQPPLEGRADGFSLGATVELSSDGDVAFVSSGLATQWVVEARAALLVGHRGHHHGRPSRRDAR